MSSQPKISTGVLASSGYNFKEMPTLSEVHDDYIDKDSTPFLGEPAKVIDAAIKGEGEEGEEEA